jgi:Ca2+-binding RTX toxin-like protein
VILLVAAAFPAAPAQAGDSVIAAAGDIACPSTSSAFNSGLGTPTRCRQWHTSNLLVGGGLSAVLPLGDLQYCCSSPAEFSASYDPSWGRVKPITRPVPGSNEYVTAGAAGYFDYFNGPGVRTGPAGERGRGYYSFDLGTWHLIALNSNCRFVGCAAGSAQERWLRADLAEHRNGCSLAYMSAPRFSSTPGQNHGSVERLWGALYDAGTEIVLSAGAHNYERFAPQTPHGRADAPYGIRQFVVGTGGHSLMGFGTPRANSEVRHADGFGVLSLVLRSAAYEWRFWSDGSSPFTDSGAGNCHATRAPAAPPKRPPGGPANCTMRGTSRNDVLRGTPRRDVICGLGGNDTIAAGGGNDVVLGGDGQDTLAGGPGRDRLYGGRGVDAIAGDDGNDLLVGGSGDDRITAGRGRDRAHGEAGSDRLIGNGGNDVLLGGVGSDSVRAGAGRDTVYGNAGDDVLRGQSGPDRLFGNSGRNRMFGNAGADHLVSAFSKRRGDRLDGGRGRDHGTIDRRDRTRSVEVLRRR